MLSLLLYSWVYSSAHQGGRCKAGDDSGAGVMAAGMSGEYGGSHSGNLEQDKAVNDNQEDQHGQLFDHLRRVYKAAHHAVVVRQQLRQDAERRRRDYLVEGETQEGAKPAPEQELQLVEDKEWNKYWAEHSDIGTGDSTVGDDYAD